MSSSTICVWNKTKLTSLNLLSPNLIRMECKTHVIHHLIKYCHISFLLKTQYILPHLDNISINSQLDWIFIWVLELIECGCAYFLIYDMIMWHVRIRGCKTWVSHHILIVSNLKLLILDLTQLVYGVWNTQITFWKYKIKYQFFFLLKGHACEYVTFINQSSLASEHSLLSPKSNS